MTMDVMPASFNEPDHLNERYGKFRSSELQRIAGESMERDYPEIVKLVECAFNKVFILLAKNNQEGIARIPPPIAGPPHYTTAT
ncbi:hypothetical protein N7540_004861 [Penicillium herquei]|nr:hypothetical protein N7540_004861 [Penicillium herquei]